MNTKNCSCASTSCSRYPTEPALQLSKCRQRACRKCSAFLSFPGSCPRLPSSVVVSVSFSTFVNNLSNLVSHFQSGRLCSKLADAQSAANKSLVKDSLLPVIGRSPLTKAGRKQMAPLILQIPGLGRLASAPTLLLLPPANTTRLGSVPARQVDEGWQFHM